MTDSGLTIVVASIAATAALAGAVIAAWTAGRRQGRQLRHEGERQKRQLQHDRELADLAELRILLDECAAKLSTTFILYAGAVASIDHHVVVEQQVAALHAQNAPQAVLDEAVKGLLELKRSQETAIADIVAAQALGERIRLRLGDTDCFTHYDAAVRALHSGSQQFPGMGTPDGRQRSLYESSADEFESGRRRFAVAARALVGSRIAAPAEHEGGSEMRAQRRS